MQDSTVSMLILTFTLGRSLAHSHTWATCIIHTWATARIHAYIPLLQPTGRCQCNCEPRSSLLMCGP